MFAWVREMRGYLSVNFVSVRWMGVLCVFRVA